MIKVNDKIKFENKYGQIQEGIVTDNNYQCDFDADLNGCIRVSVDYGSSIIGTVNTLIDKSQVIQNQYKLKNNSLFAWNCGLFFVYLLCK